MEIFNNLLLGFSVAVSPIHLLYALIGVMLGTLIGVLPGVGPVATIAMLLPITFNLSPIAALIMLAGIYYGAQYGGSTTAILVNLTCGVGGGAPGRRSPPPRWARSSPAASRR
jgi:putative tricarboxylic transport membrane protein